MYIDAIRKEEVVHCQTYIYVILHVLRNVAEMPEYPLDLFVNVVLCTDSCCILCLPCVTCEPEAFSNALYRSAGEYEICC